MIREISNFKFQISNRKSQIANPSARWRGFTLIEVLVVIAIIGMLAAFLLPAIMSAKKAAKRTAIKMEMAQLALAIEQVRTTIGVGQYPPDGTNVADSTRFLKAAFPRCPNLPTLGGSGSAFNPTTALVFWLGGAQDGTGQFIGFSANPQNPFDNSPGRIGPFFDFGKATATNPRFGQFNNVSAGGSSIGLWQYFPDNGQASGMPYVYLKAVAGSYPTSTPIYAPGGTSQTGTIYAYMDSTAAGSPMNPKTYQLLCPGLDGKYGVYTAAPSYPSGPYDNVNGTDDMSNFTIGATLGDDAP